LLYSVPQLCSAHVYTHYYSSEEMRSFLLLCVLLSLGASRGSPWGWLDNVLDTAKDTVEKAVKVAEEASDVTKNVAKDAYTGAKKLAEKAITAVEEANYGSKLKNVAEDTFGAFKDVGNFMSNCMKSLPSPIADKAYLESLESQNISAEGASWMSQIPDSRILSHITIPGTHNSMTYSLGDVPIGGVEGWAQNQYASLEDQLRMGIRFLDIRLRHVGDHFKIHHGEFYTGHDLSDVLDVVTEFLEKNENETVLISYQEAQAHTAGKTNRTFCETLESYIYQDNYNRSSFSSYTHPNLPTLGEARGKILYIDQHKKGCPGFPKSKISELNEWSLDREDLKTTYKTNLVAHLTLPPSNSTLSLTWCSAYVAKPAKCQLKKPLSVSRTVNPWLTEVGQPRGIVVMDFPAPSVIQNLYLKN